MKEIRKNLEIQNSERIFFVTGKRSFKESGAEDIIRKEFSDNEYEFYSDFSGDPKLSDIERGVNVFRKNSYDRVIAIGGGSVIDTAKLINVISANEADAVDIATGKAAITIKGKPLTAIPTTSGAGSEATHFAVLYNGDEKFSVAHEFVYPDSVILDPTLTYNLSKEITATSGIDALSQAIESYWNVHSTTESKKYSIKAIELILKNLEKAVNAPDDESRSNMSVAANLSGKAINITKTTAPHAVSYTITSHFGVPHGQAVSITLGEFLKFNSMVTESDHAGEKGFEEVKKSMDDLLKILGSKTAQDAAVVISDLMKSIGLKTRLSETGIEKDEDLKLIADNVNLERLKNNPRQVTRDALDKILRNVL